MIKKILFIILLVPTTALSDPATDKRAGKDYAPEFVLIDILIYRPIGFAATVAGTGLFVAISPLTAFAQIAPPHDAFQKAADVLIFAPGEFTFVRPVGDRTMGDY